jgi:hypothetical protein
MTVYVDELREWMGKSWCHMVATSAEELEMFALGHLGIPEWNEMKDRETGHTYYNITDKQRKTVIGWGAKEITTARLVEMAAKTKTKEV